MTDQKRSRGKRFQRWLMGIVGIPLLYVLSSGPVLGLAFRLREATGWDGFYAAMFLYYPVLVFGLNNPIGKYIEWWVVSVFRTVGPG